MSDRKKPIRFRKRLSLLVAVLLSIVIVVVILKKSSVLPNRLNRYVNEHYLKDSNFRFSCRSVTGDLVNTVSLSDVRLRYYGEDGAIDLFRAKQITMKYSILEVLKLNLAIERLTMEDTDIRLIRDNSGALLLPPLPSGGGVADSKPVPSIVVEQYEFRGLDVLYRDSTRTIDIEDIAFAGGLRLQDGEGHIEIERGSAFLPATRTQLQSIRFSASYIDNLISLDNLVIMLDRSYIMASGKYLDGTVRHLQFVFNPLDLQEISSLGLIPENSGEIGGNITISGSLDTLNVRGSITGKVSGLVFSGFSFAGMKSGPAIEFSQLEGTVFGSYIKGLFRYDMGADGGYYFDGTCRGLDISEGFISADGIPDTDLYGSIEMEYRRRSDRYRFSAVLDTSSVDKFKSKRIRFDGRWSAAGLAIDRVEFENPGFTLTGAGSISPSSDIDLIVNLNGHDLAYMWNYLELPLIDSKVSVSGRVAGPADNLKINLNGSIRDASFLFAAIDSGEIQAEIRNVPSDVSAKVDLRGQRITLSGMEFTEPHIALEAGSGSVDFTDFSFSNGDTLLTTDFLVVPDGDDQDILFKHILIKMPSETWASQSAVTLHLSGGTAVLDTVTLGSPSGSMRLAGTYTERGERFDVHVEGRAVEASLLQHSLGIPWQMKGKSRFNADLSGTLEKSNMRVDFALGPGSIRTIPFDGVRFVCRFDSAGYTLEDLRIRSNGDSLSGSGTWRLPLSPLQLAKRADRQDQMLRSPWSFDLSGTQFPLATVFGALNRKPPFAGAYSGSISVRGMPRDARFVVRGVLSAVAESSMQFPDLTIAAVYEDSLLDINSITFDDGKMQGSIDGRMPVRFDLTDGFQLRTRSPFTLNASVNSRDLSILAAYLDEIDLSRGSLKSTLSAHGTLDNPRFSGNLDFQDCTIRLSGMEEIYSKVNGRITLLDNMVQLSALSGKVGKNGTFHGSGFAELQAFKPVRYRVGCTMENFLFTSIHDFLSLHDGTISLSSLGSGDKPLTPVLSGQLQIKQATITRSLAADTDGAPSPLTMPSESPSWFCDLEIVAPKKIFIKNPGLNMELGGDVILKRDKSGVYLRGELNVLRGSYALYNNKFTITDGLFNFSAATAMRPEIDLNAYSLYRMGDEEHRIFLNLSWPQDKKEPKVTLSSDSPGYSETDIWKMMGGTYVASGRSESGWDAAGTAQNIAGNYLEGVLNAQMHDLTIDLESRTLDGSGGTQRPEREMTIAIGKYLSEDLYLKYRQGLSISSEREVDIEYRIGTMLILRSEIIRHSGRQLLGKSSQAADEINFDIKLRFEY